MANLNKYDPRLESLVIETRTTLGFRSGRHQRGRPALGSRRRFTRNPHLAAKVKYERSHTGFTREITVTVADIERLYEERLSS